VVQDGVVVLERDQDVDQQLVKAWPDAAKALGIKRSKLWELIMTGELESVKIGASRLVPQSAIGDYVRKLREQARHGDAA
jgi:excisionase family DNA binding protein